MAARRVQRTVYLDVELDEAVRRIAERDDRSVSYMIEKLVQVGVEKTNDEELAVRAGGTGA